VKKYLYGKKRFLKDLISGKSGLRFSDIIHYSIMENELMRDDERTKVFELSKESFKLYVNDRQINPMDMVGGPSLTMPVDRCYCVCLSSKSNDPVLFERFQADVCLEIDLENLLQFLSVAVEKFEGMAVVHRDVNYYPSIMSDAFPDLDSILFYKRDVYSVESEYRIAITVPPHRTHFKGEGNDRIKMFSDDVDDVRHLFINGNTPEINQSFVTGVFYFPEDTKPPASS